MNTQISTKLTALTAALIVNALMIASIASLFNGQLHQSLFATMAHPVAVTHAKV